MHYCYQRRYCGPLQGVILDWAGTTVDYGCKAPAIVFVDMFKRHGVDITIEEARLPMGQHKRDHIKAIAGMERVREAWEAANGAAPTEADIDDMFEKFVPAQLKVLAEYADLIPGTVETMAAFRKRGLKIGSTTGYTAAIMEVLEEAAAKQGYTPDSMVCGTEVPAGRPAPWMAFKNAMNLGIYPMESMVKIGDTLPDIAEGLNAGMWVIALVMTGNEFGLDEAEIAAMDPQIRAAKRQASYNKFAQAGAHYVVDTIADCLPILDAIEARLAQGERP